MLPTSPFLPVERATAARIPNAQILQSVRVLSRSRARTKSAGFCLRAQKMKANLTPKHAEHL
jgi:hypothetical protein